MVSMARSEYRLQVPQDAHVRLGGRVMRLVDKDDADVVRVDLLQALPLQCLHGRNDDV